MKLNLRIGEAIELTKQEYRSEYEQAPYADEVGHYLHQLCTFYSELVGKNVSMLNPLAFACKYYRMYLQNNIHPQPKHGEDSLTHVLQSFNDAVLREFEQSKVRQKDKKMAKWKSWSTDRLNAYTLQIVE